MLESKKFQLSYLVVLLGIQLTVLSINNSSLLESVSAIAGVFYVSLLAFKKRPAFLFALLFNALLLIIGIQHGVYSEIVQQPMFFTVNLMGALSVYNLKQPTVLKNLLSWVKNINLRRLLIFSSLVIIIWIGLSSKLGSSVPVHDGILGGVAIVAQVLSIVERKESWYGWMTLNIISALTWHLVGNTPLSIMYGVFFINAVIGYILWNRENLGFNK